MNQSKSVALILPYFGTFPNYFHLWLASAGKNSDFDFILITDANTDSYDVPSNVKVISLTLDDIKSRISKCLPYKFNLNEPYKLCDYRPLYGLIFSDLMASYDFWGHCDPDVIWGDLNHFITDDLLSSYDRIFVSGHLTIYRNCDDVNYTVLKQSPKSLLSAKDVFTTNYSAHFDEGSGLLELQHMAKLRIFSSIYCADVLYSRKSFYTLEESGHRHIDYFEYRDGHVYGIDTATNYRNEYSYVHLQKRKMDVECTAKDNYVIIPNAFVDAFSKETLTNALLDEPEYNKNERHKLLKRRISNLFSGALKFRLYHLMDKIIYRNGK